MPNLDLKQLRETFEKSTKGEWRPDVRTALNGNYWCANTPWRVKCAQNEEVVKADGEWLATAHNTYAQLLDIAEAAAHMRTALRGMKQSYELLLTEVAKNNPILQGVIAGAFCGEPENTERALAAYRKAREGKE